MTTNPFLITDESERLRKAFMLLARLHRAAVQRLMESRSVSTDQMDAAPAGDSDPEEELSALARLDPEAITRIHSRYFPAVYNFARYRLNDEILAEDVSAEAFARLLEYSCKGRGPRTNIRGWLMRTTANLVNDYYRVMYSHPTTGLPETLISASPGPVAVFEANEDNRRLHEALRKLTEEQATVLALRFGSGFSLAETAEALGKKPNAVKALQFRAIGALRRELVRA